MQHCQSAVTWSPPVIAASSQCGGPEVSQTSYLAPKADAPANSKTKATWLFLDLTTEVMWLLPLEYFTGYID